MADNLTDISSLTINDTLFDVATTTMPLDLASSTFTITNLDLTIMNNLTTEMKLIDDVDNNKTIGPEFGVDNSLDQQSLEIKQAREIAWSGVFIGSAFANLLILTVLLAVTRGKRGYYGIRLYVLNLNIFAWIQILILAWTQPDDYFGLEKIVSLCVRDFLNKYDASLLEWTQIVYLSATTILIGDCIQRYRNHGLGLNKLSYSLAVLIVDIIPMIYIFVKGIGFEFSEIRPKPLAIYHVVVLVLFTLAGALLTLMVVCLPVYRVCGGTRHTEMAVNADRARQHALREKTLTNQLIGPPSVKPFTYAKLLALWYFVALTGWTQYTVFNLGVDLQPGGLDEAREMAKSMNAQDGGAMHAMLKTVNQERLIYIIMSIQKWAAMVRPFLETLFALLLLLLPSIGSKFRLRVKKVTPLTSSIDVIRMTQHQHGDVIGGTRSANATMRRVPSAPE